ncbi:MAG: hypothetical protein J6T16_03320 [Opitutales bacterium]|nr:hypothetical protein [Opitutales bacterium]
MKTCTYDDCFNDFIALTGLENAPDALVKARFNAWFNIRLREIWRARRWSFLVRTAPIFVCDFHWVDLPEDVENGDIFEIFDGDFRTDKNAKRVRFYLEAGKSAICEQIPAAKLKLSKFDANAEYAKGDAYLRGGKPVFKGGGGEIELTNNVYAQGYLENSASEYAALERGDIVVSAGDIFYTAGVWNGSGFEQFSVDFFERRGVVRYKAVNQEYRADFGKKVLPYAFKSFIAEATRANWLSAENRPEEAAAAEGRARAFLEDEVYRDECNQYSSTPVNFC